MSKNQLSRFLVCPKGKMINYTLLDRCLPKNIEKVVIGEQEYYREKGMKEDITLKSLIQAVQQYNSKSFITISVGLGLN